MSSRNLTEVFNIMRNNASKHRSLYFYDREERPNEGDGELLLKRQGNLREAEEGLELQDEIDTQPNWIDKLEEAQYTLSKIRPKLDELGSLQTRHLLRPTFDEGFEDGNGPEMKLLSDEISKLIGSVHRHIQCIRSSLGVGSKREQLLTSAVVMCLMLSLQDLTIKFRNTQSTYLNQLNSREERSQQFFDIFNNPLQTDDDGAATVIISAEGSSVCDLDNDKLLRGVDKFSTVPLNSNSDNSGNLTSSALPQFPDVKLRHMVLFEDELDEHFQRPMNDQRPLTQQQLLLFEEENERLATSRDQEVSKMVSSIHDLNDIFKDLNQLVQHQGTILDRIDYSIEQTQSRVTEGVQQLQRAEMYQRKNRKMCIIISLACITFLMLLLLIITKF